MFYLSQTHLEAYQSCPPRFQSIHLDQLVLPSDSAHREKQQWGIRFHQAMQQLQLGLSLEMVASDPELHCTLESLLAHMPKLLVPQEQTYQASEYRRTLGMGNFLLTIVCDWVTSSRESLQIYDWKTYKRPQQTAHLKAHWQTQLYLYVLAVTTDYAPEQLTMTYWFIAPGEQPQSVTFAYDSVWHEQIHLKLTHLLSQLQRDLERYFEQGIEFSHLDRKSCPNCPTQGHHDAIAPPSFLGDKSPAEFLKEIEAVQL